MNKLKSLAGETLVYGLGNTLPRLLNFFLILPHTEIFDPEEYGVITKLYAYVAVINVLYMFGMETSYFRYATKNKENAQRAFNIAQTVVTGITLLFTITFVVFSRSIAASLEINNVNYIIWFVGIMAIDALVAIPFAKLRLERKMVLFGAAKLLNISVLVLLNLIFLTVIYDPAVGVEYVFIANLVANVCYLFFFIKTFYRWRPTLDKELTPSMMVYSYPIMFTGLAGMTNEMFSRIALERWLPAGLYPGKSGEYVLGVFGANYKFATLMNLAVQAFRFAAEPFFFSNATDRDSPQLFARINHYFIIVCCILLLGVGINLDILKYLLRNPEYREGLTIVPILLLAYLFVGVYYNLTIWFKITDRTYFGTIITVGGAIVTIVLNYYLIPVWGYHGSAIAALACYFLMAAACYWLGKKFYPIPYQITKGLAYIIGTTLLMYAVQAITFTDQWLATSFHVVVIALYLLVVYLTEKKELKQSLGSIF